MFCQGRRRTDRPPHAGATPPGRRDPVALPVRAAMIQAPGCARKRRLRDGVTAGVTGDDSTHLDVVLVLKPCLWPLPDLLDRGCSLWLPVWTLIYAKVRRVRQKTSCERLLTPDTLRRPRESGVFSGTDRGLRDPVRGCGSAARTFGRVGAGERVLRLLDAAPAGSHRVPAAHTRGWAGRIHWRSGVPHSRACIRLGEPPLLATRRVTRSCARQARGLAKNPRYGDGAEGRSIGWQRQSVSNACSASGSERRHIVEQPPGRHGPH